MPKMRVLSISSELTPLAKVGGLADVAGSLPTALKKGGVDIRSVIPSYEIIKPKKEGFTKILKNITVEFNKKEEFINIWEGFIPKTKVPIYLIEHKKFFKGGVYPSPDAASNGSNGELERFGFFSVAVLKFLKIFKWDPQILHCHDWHTGLIPLLVKKNFLEKKILFTIHNLGYQGWYDKKVAENLLNISFKNFRGTSISTLRQAILNADKINTVSVNYAREIMTPEFGSGLEDDLKKRRKDISGILNGIDIKNWNPRTDTFIKENFSKKNIIKKNNNKFDLQKEVNLIQDKNKFLIGIVSRLTEQKGFDIILPIIKNILDTDSQIIILATGDKNYTNDLKKIRHKNLAFINLFDKKIAHKIYGGADTILIPSRYEPCGLTQMIAMRYGTVPIVRAVGGLKDTVKNNITGFTFTKYSPETLFKSIQKSKKNFNNKLLWNKIQENCFEKDFSWEASAKKYIKIYKQLISCL